MKIIYSKYNDYDEKDILICDVLVIDNKGKKRREKFPFCKEEQEFTINQILKKFKLKTAKSIEFTAIKKIGRRNELS